MYSFLIWIYAFLLFNFVIMAHEWGHFITARKFGIKVNEFALGMGPQIIKIERGETVYSLRLLPIGGFCAMEGEEEEGDKNQKVDSSKKIDPSRSFKSKPTWQRAIVMFAGVFMNMVVGVALSILLTAIKPNVYGNKISDFDPAYASNFGDLKIGDEIISIGGYKIHVSRDILFATGVSENNYDVEVIRNGQFVTLKDVNFTITDAEGNKSLGISLEKIDKNFINVVNYAVADVGASIRNSWNGILGLLKGTFSLKDFNGPVGMASQIGGIARQEKNSLLAVLRITSFMMVISISLAVFNLLPFPALDGGRVLLLIPEMITGKPVNQKVEVIINTAGIVLLMLMTVLITYNDIVTIFRGPQ